MTILLEERVDEKKGEGERNRKSNIAAKVGTPKDNQKSIKPRHKEPKYTPEETGDLDPEDSAMYQRFRPKTMGTDGAKEGYVTEFRNQKPVDIPTLFSYVGSGVREQHKIESEDTQKGKFEESNAPPTFTEVGDMIEHMLVRTVTQMNDPLPPDAKERFLLAIQLPEGRVLLRLYETAGAFSVMRTLNTNYHKCN